MANNSGKVDTRTRTPLKLTAEVAYCVIDPFDQIILDSIATKENIAVRNFLKAQDYPETTLRKTQNCRKAFKRLMTYGYNTCEIRIQTIAFIGARRHFSTAEIHKLKKALESIKK